MKKIIAIVVLVFFLIISGYGYWKYYFTYSEGNRTGLLQKFSKRGTLFKTYEGELLLNSVVVNNANQFGSEKFYFSVTDENLAQKLMEYEGNHIVLEYKQKNGVLFWRGDTPYIVDSVRVVK